MKVTQEKLQAIFNEYPLPDSLHSKLKNGGRSFGNLVSILPLTSLSENSSAFQLSYRNGKKFIPLSILTMNGSVYLFKPSLLGISQDSSYDNDEVFQYLQGVLLDVLNGFGEVYDLRMEGGKLK